MSKNITLCVFLAALGGCRAATIVEEVLTEDRLDVTYPLVVPEQNVISGSIFDNLDEKSIYLYAQIIS